MAGRGVASEGGQPGGGAEALARRLPYLRATGPRLPAGPLQAQAVPPGDAEFDICSVSPRAQYRGRENQHYRVEIFSSGVAAPAAGQSGIQGSQATYVWSRDNGSVVFAIDSLAGAEVTVASLGRDIPARLEIGDWVEIVDDASASRIADDVPAAVRARAVFQVTAIDPLGLVVTLDRDPSQVIGTTGTDPARHPLLRRWDGVGAGDAAGAGIPLAEGNRLPLEDGVRVRFPGVADSEGGPARYRNGDYWLIPARTVSAMSSGPRSLPGRRRCPRPASPTTMRRWRSSPPAAIPSCCSRSSARSRTARSRSRQHGTASAKEAVMSSVVSGALATRREQSDSGTSTSEQPPGLSTYVDVLSALVPAEVLAINSVVITLVTKLVPGGGTQPTDPATLRLTFWLLLGLSSVLYLLGRQQSLAQARRPRDWTPADAVRMLIPAAAFTGWAMLEPSSAWSSVAPGMSSGTRILIAIVGATALAAITKALATQADLKPALGDTSAASGDGAAQGGGGGQPGAGPAGDQAAGQRQLPPVAPAAFSPGPASATPALPGPPPNGPVPAPIPPGAAPEDGPWWVSSQ